MELSSQMSAMRHFLADVTIPVTIQLDITLKAVIVINISYSPAYCAMEMEPLTGNHFALKVSKINVQ